MKKTKKITSILKVVPEKVGNTSELMGKGLMAGFIGTGVMTLIQLIEMKITKREESDTPVKAIEEITGAEISEENNTRLNNAIHFLYGTGWGKMRALIAQFGMNRWLASLVHFGLVWSASLVMLPKLKIAPPIREWGAKAIVLDAVHHLIYAASVGLVYDEIDERTTC